MSQLFTSAQCMVWEGRGRSDTANRSSRQRVRKQGTVCVCVLRRLQKLGSMTPTRIVYGKVKFVATVCCTGRDIHKNTSQLQTCIMTSEHQLAARRPWTQLPAHTHLVISQWWQPNGAFPGSHWDEGGRFMVRGESGREDTIRLPHAYHNIT